MSSTSFWPRATFSPESAIGSQRSEFIINRLKTEIFNQAFGVEKGDEVEAQRDPVIQKALETIARQ